MIEPERTVHSANGGVIWAGQALLAGGWRSDVLLDWQAGRLRSVQPDVAAAPGAERVGIAVPGMADLHSHAFQRAMAGLAETAGPTADTFWTWREAMYRFVLAMTPDDVEATAALLYCELLEAGFTRVGEFHYLHHDLDGRPYADVAEMAGKVAAAAEQTGIGLTLLPVLYQFSGFAGAAAQAGQRRFVCGLDAFATLVLASRACIRDAEGAVLGVAPHSLRAVGPEGLAHAIALAPSGPLHIHAAEQRQEVADCLAWSGTRPVAWLLDHAAVDGRWCLIHATHIDATETARLAASGSVAGLCPVTEGNLGDGVFPATAFRAAGGRFGIGTDSNVSLSAAGELRQLEYTQRLAHGVRNAMADPGASTGRSLFDAAAQGGAAALGAGPSGLVAGAWADIVALDPDHPSLVGRNGDRLLDSWIFSAGNEAVDRVWARGRKVVEGGRHLRREAAARRYRATLGRLLA